jgi:hypothetical protein
MEHLDEDMGDALDLPPSATGVGGGGGGGPVAPALHVPRPVAAAAATAAGHTGGPASHMELTEVSV